MRPIALDGWVDLLSQPLHHTSIKREEERTFISRNTKNKPRLRQLLLEPHEQLLVYRAARLVYRHQVWRFHRQPVLVCALARSVELEVEVAHDLDLDRC